MDGRCTVAGTGHRVTIPICSSPRYTAYMMTMGWMALWMAVGCRGDDPGPAPARRLTATEYNNTVRDLLGFAVDDTWPDPDNAWPWPFPEESTQFGFEGMSEAQGASAVLVEAQANAALHFSAFIDVAPAFWMCTSDGRDEACAWNSVLRFAKRAWRRPLSEEEETRLQASLTDLITDVGVEDGAQLMVAAVLMSPQMLYRLEYADEERGSVVALTPWEQASRLSYFLWETMPDATLFEAAANGALSTPEDLAAQVDRMLQDPRAESALLHFHEQWLELDALYSAKPDMETHAERISPGLLSGSNQETIFTEDVWSGAMVGTRKAMHAEARLFLAEEIAQSGTLAGLLTSERTFASWMTAAASKIQQPFSTGYLYGVDRPDGTPVVSEEFTDRKMNFTMEIYAVTPPENQRAGVLTLGATLTSRAHPIHPAPIQRGVFVLERLTCESLGVPPEGASSELPAESLDLDGTNRSRTESITADGTCTGCHSRINPAGFAFEHYDALGGWRTEDNGSAVDASGSLTLLSGESFSFDDAPGLANALASSRQVHDCYAQHWLRSAFGREVTDEEPGVQDIKDAFFDSGGDIATLLHAIVQSELFRTRRANGS